MSTGTGGSAPGASLVADDTGAVRLRGELTFATVPQLHPDGRRVIEQCTSGLEMDLSGVTRADSAGLALLVDWLAYAGTRQCALRYAHLPASIEALAGLSDVSALLKT